MPWDARAGKDSAESCAQVNNQNVFGTLMNIADNPNRVSIAQIWRQNDVIGRVPIIVTGGSRLRPPLFMHALPVLQRSALRSCVRASSLHCLHACFLFCAVAP
jgi:hypothetical protein